MKDKELIRTAGRVQEALLQLRQGYYLAHPLSAPDLEEFLEKVRQAS